VVTTGQGSFDVAVTHGHAYVSGGTGVTVLDASKSTPAVLWSSPLSPSQGEALTPDHQHLLVTGGDGIAVFSVSQLEQGAAGPVGTLSSPGQKHAVEVVVTPDGRFAFVTYQESANVGVFNLQRALSQGFGAPGLVGLILVPPVPIGIAMAPDGRHVYVTSRQSTNAQSQAGVVNVIDVAKATAHPSASAIIAKVPAGCAPSRVITSPDGQQVWVTASKSNALLGFDAAKMITDSTHALVARVAVGETPLGLIMIKHGTRIVVADSNRDKAAGAVSNLAVVNVQQARAGKPALLGYVQSGVTPRQFALTSHGNTLLVTNTDSGQLQAVSLSHVP
jgi:DNA-binding beta-propeller fold protein YncE